MEKDLTKQHLKRFYRSFPFLEIDALIEYFSFFGGVEDVVEIDAFAGVEANIQYQIIDRFDHISDTVSPSYLLQEPYRKLLISIARGDGKIFSLFRRARIGESAGGEIVAELMQADIVQIEESREAPPTREYGEKLPKELRRYRIQSKVRFSKPFYRFWFGFVEPYRFELEKGEDGKFWDNFRQHKERAQSLVFEHLSNALLLRVYAEKDPIISYGSWWNKTSEYDLLALTKGGKIILGECKYKGRKITKRELTKLKDKALHTGIRAEVFALFSRNGFSRELIGMKNEKLLLFSIEDYARLLQG